jgi:D-alanyl-D-alanine carboxypeptidase
MGKAQFAYRRPAVKGPQTREILSTNRLLRHEHPEHWDLADGVKTGYTRAAGRCLCASATEDGWQLLCVVLDCKDCWADGRNLLSWGFRRYRRQGVVAANATTAEVHVLNGKAPVVEAVAKSSIDLIGPVDQPPPTPRLSEGYPEAPVKAGDEVGELVVGRADGTQLSATLVAARDVPRSLAARVRDHAGGLVVAVVVLALIGALLVHGAVAAVAGARRYRIAQKVRRDRESRARDGEPSPGATSGAEDQRPARPGAA